MHGVSAIQFIETSNVVYHPLPMLNAVYVNVFSFKEFDIDAANRFSIEILAGGFGRLHGGYQNVNRRAEEMSHAD